MCRLEQRATEREHQLERRVQELEQRDQRLDQREEEMEQLRAGIDDERGAIAREMERVASLSQQEARNEILQLVERELDADVAERIRQADQRVREEATERAREILISA